MFRAIVAFLIFSGTSSVSFSQIKFTQGLLALTNKQKNEKHFCDLTHIEVSTSFIAFTSYDSKGKLLCRCRLEAFAANAGHVVTMLSNNIGKKNLSIVCNSPNLLKSNEGAWIVDGVNPGKNNFDSFNAIFGELRDPTL